MFGFNKKKPLIEGPVGFEMEVEIDRPAAEVFRLIDLADSGFAAVQRGATVTTVPGTEDSFTLRMPELEDITFKYKVVERVVGQRHSAECVIEPPVGNLAKALEEYAIEALSENSCRLDLTTHATFNSGLSDEEIAGEIAMMSMAVQDDLFKLKVHAEDGAEAVAAMEEDDDLGFELDLGDLDLDWDDIEPQQ